MADYNYVFTAGKYRAKVKTTYRRDDMSMNDFVYSDAYEFTSTYTPVIPPEYEFITNINKYYIGAETTNLFDYPKIQVQNITGQIDNSLSGFTIYGGMVNSAGTSDSHLGSGSSSNGCYLFSPVITANVNARVGASGYDVTYSNASIQVYPFDNIEHYILQAATNGQGVVHPFFREYNHNNPSAFSTGFLDLQSALSYLYRNFCNINICVDGVLWVSANQGGGA